MYRWRVRVGVFAHQPPDLFRSRNEVSPTWNDRRRL